MTAECVRSHLAYIIDKSIPAAERPLTADELDALRARVAAWFIWASVQVESDTDPLGTQYAAASTDARRV